MKSVSSIMSYLHKSPIREESTGAGPWHIYPCPCACSDKCSALKKAPKISCNHLHLRLPRVQEVVNSSDSKKSIVTPRVLFSTWFLYLCFHSAGLKRWEELRFKSENEHVTCGDASNNAFCRHSKIQLVCY